MTAVTCVLLASVIHSLLKKVFRNLCLKLLSDTFTVKESLQLNSEIAAHYERTGGRPWRTMTNNCKYIKNSLLGSCLKPQKPVFKS